jgi:hypothetical protein
LYGGIYFAPFALGSDAHQHVPQIGLGDEMIAAIALDMPESLTQEVLE